VKSTRLVLVFCGCLAAGTLWPADAAAQRRGAPVHVRTGVVISAGYYRPYYRPYFYDPFFFYGGFYDPFYLGFYPAYAQYPGRYYGYAYRGNWASARIEVKPRDAQVFVDGYMVGIVDQFDGIFQRLDLPAGEHELVIYMKGYRPYAERALFRPGQSYHFKAILEPLPAGTPDAPVPHPAANAPDPYNQGRDPRDPYARDPRDPYGREPMGDPNRMPPPPPPSAGRMPPPERPGDRRPPEGSFGTLNIRVQPGDAVIVIDGERWDSPDGGSRLAVQLSAGPHRIEVRKDGFKPYTSTVQIRPGETQALNISLPQGN
jgi:hypothetical protein